MTRSTASAPHLFFGRRVIWAAAVMAMFGWGVGVYGPPIYLHAVIERTGWSLSLVSVAVTVHFLAGALVIANLPRIHARFGLPATTAFGAALTSLGVLGWATAALPWQLVASALVSGSGWVTMGAAVINAVIAPWFARTRPRALAGAYNGASIGGLVFSPLWVALIGQVGFAGAAVIVGVMMTGVVSVLAFSVFAKTPASLGQMPDGDDPGATQKVGEAIETAPPLPHRRFWRDRRLATLAAGMAAGLFAQMGLLAHLYLLLVPALGTQAAGLLMGCATAAAVAGRSFVARSMPAGADRRRVACGGYAVQLIGTFVLLAAGEAQVGLMVLGVLLFGSGIGNATSLPPLVAQTEFAAADVQRAVSLIVAIAQATYAFAPALMGVVLMSSGDTHSIRIGSATVGFFAVVALIQAVAIGCLVAGRRRA